MKKVLLFAIAVACSACGASSQTVVSDVTKGVNLTKAICKALETQPMPEAVVFACTVINAAPSELASFTLTVPKDQAPAFAAKYGAPSQQENAR